MLFHRFVGLGGDALAYRALSPILAPSPELCDTPNIGHGVVHHLVFHGAFDLLAVACYRMGCADRGVGRHDGYVGRHGNKGAGRGGSRAGRRHVDHHGHTRSVDALNNVPHGGVQPSWRVQLYHDGHGVLLLSQADATAEVAGHYGSHGALGGEDEHDGGRR